MPSLIQTLSKTIKPFQCPCGKNLWEIYKRTTTTEEHRHNELILNCTHCDHKEVVKV